ncbi:uncharacterized protein HD556DRAFT_1311932 [Suillus plorans]|uniref:Uncharacterized protein n=1 Tax=Suillus plorans TaxID=116603 RepID=A0A9P7DDR6_9AGAM|nr:uncharacterized protein HD556DRAFT_1311932 [Suillus plorans]KAG1788679.1 hypothetical protein HD556DRAFT_1311932 [Suillus plorans]
MLLSFSFFLYCFFLMLSLGLASDLLLKILGAQGQIFVDHYFELMLATDASEWSMKYSASVAKDTTRVTIEFRVQKTNRKYRLPPEQPAASVASVKAAEQYPLFCPDARTVTDIGWSEKMSENGVRLDRNGFSRVICDASFLMGSVRAEWIQGLGL